MQKELVIQQKERLRKVGSKYLNEPYNLQNQCCSPKTAEVEAKAVKMHQIV